MILDEAVSSLDVIVQKRLLDLLAELQEEYKLTYLFISHNLRAVRNISQRIVVMYNGRIVEAADTEELLSNPIHPYTKKMLQAAMNYSDVDATEDFYSSSKCQTYRSGRRALRGRIKNQRSKSKNKENECRLIGTKKSILKNKKSVKYFNGLILMNLVFAVLWGIAFYENRRPIHLLFCGLYFFYIVGVLSSESFLRDYCDER